MSQEVFACIHRLRAAVRSVMVGQAQVVDATLAALLAGGHVLLEGPPGTGKTLLVKALARGLASRFRRVQMTPDLMPSDLVGTSIWDFQTNKFRFVAGPVFTNLLLADELNRAPAKTQSALLECMGEGQVTVEGRSCKLPELFLVLGTENPMDHEGTYPLPEAQLDRFMLRVPLDYPSEAEELRLLDLHEEGQAPAEALDRKVQPLTTEAEVLAARAHLSTITVAPELREYVNQLVRATRDHPGLEVGAGPRATIDLYRAAKAWAVLEQRDFVVPDDVKQLYLRVVAHRVVVAHEAEGSGATPERILGEILERQPVPR